MKDSSFARFVLFVNGLVPGVLLLWNIQTHRLGADPVGFCQDVTGFLALLFLVLSLSVTPLRKITGFNFLSNFRRQLGLFAFFYASCHFAIYFIILQDANIRALIDGVARNFFILFGMIAWLAMIPLALTSTAGMIRRLGAKNWKRLHRLAYVAAVSGGIHYYYRFKTPHELPIVFAILIALLLLARIIRLKKPAPRPARPSSSPAA